MCVRATKIEGLAPQYLRLSHESKKVASHNRMRIKFQKIDLLEMCNFSGIRSTTKN